MSPAGTLTTPKDQSALADLLSVVVKRFTEGGALGLVVVRASGLEAIERSHGLRGYQKVRAGLQDVVGRYVADNLSHSGIVMPGELGADEVVVAICRPRSERAFYTERLPRIPDHLRSYIEQHASRILYPFFSDPPEISAGCATALYNPTLLEERQIHTALREARRDADLSTQTRERQRRRSFEQLLLGEHVLCLYQPIVDLRRRELHGHEALIRGSAATEWETPEQLFETAEKTGLVFELDCLCRKAALRSAAGKMPPGAKLFLNCLPSAIHDVGFRADRLRQTLEASQLTPGDIVFEISEKESIKNFQIFRETRDYFRALGIQFALDDTGSGYASLEAMMQVAPDYVKVTASLIKSINTDPARHALMDALQSMAKAIGASIVAEGIETEAELVALQDLGVPYGQGFFLGRPAALAE